MNFIKTIALCASLAMLSACSTTSSNMDGEEGSTKASREQVEELETKVGDRVFFEFDSSALTAEAQETLKKQAAFMNQNPDLTFVIEGHADERGAREYNIALGARRGEAARQYLINLGVPAHKLQMISYGKERPAVLGDNEFAWSQNRRAVTCPK